VQRLMHSYNRVNQFLRQVNADEQALINHIIQQEQ
jgi:hypothetical protein